MSHDSFGYEKNSRSTRHHTAAKMQHATSGVHVQFDNFVIHMYHSRLGYNAIYNHFALRLSDCKVALATLRTDLTWIQDGGYTAVDPTSPRLSMAYQSLTVWYVPGAVYEGYERTGRPVGLPESAVTSGKFQNGVWKAMESCSADSFVVLKCHTIYTYCTGASALIATFNLRLK